MQAIVIGSAAHGTTAAVGVFGFVALILAFKAVKFIFKLVLGAIALVLLGGSVWWLLQGH